jgi:hypothetical protein
MITKTQEKHLKILFEDLDAYTFNSTSERSYWLILNKLAKHKNWTPITIVDKVKELGMICFNNDINHHPIDWLYNECLNNK